MKLVIPKIYKSLNELIDRFKFQLYVLCIWKNIQIYKRNKVRLCMEILWPLLFVGIVVLMRYNYGDRAYLRQDECHFYSKPLLSAGFFEFLHGYICHFNNTCHQEYVENDNFFANQTSQLSAAFLEINKFMEEEKNSTGDILIQFLSQLGQYDTHKNNIQTDKYLKMEKDVKDQFSMDNFINLHQHLQDILRLPKVKRVLRHFRPLLNQLKNWISSKSTLYDDDIIAILGGMKLICGPKFYLDYEDLEKINVETLLREILLRPFKTEYRDMKSEFCQNLDEKIKDIPMLNKIWITIKPLFIGKLLFTPRNAATWKIMQNVNTTFERFAFYHKYARDFLNFLNVAFQKIKDIQGEETFEKHNIDILSFTRHLEMAYKISSKISEALDCLNVDRIVGFSSESDLVDYARHHIDQNTFFAGVVFLDMEDNKKEGPTDNLTSILNFVRYKIRMDSQKIDPTDSLYDDDEPYTPRRHPLTHLKYYYHGFVILQELLDTAITDISSNNSIFNETYIHKPRVTLQQYPRPCYNRDEFLRSFYWILPLQICLSWTLTIAIIILTMVEESKNYLHQYYRIFGMNDTMLILAQLATLLIPTFISSALTALILFKGRIILYSDTLAIVLILFNYGLTIVCLGIFFGTLLRKYSVSPYIGVLMYLMFTFLPYYINKAQSTLVFAQRILLWLIPSVPFVDSFLNIIDLEIAQVGLQWDNIVFRQKELPMSFVDNFIILIFDAILFIGSSIMIEKAKTNFYSETFLKIWHILKQKIRQRVKKEKMDEANVVKKFIQNDLYMEKEPISSKCRIEIINLTKATLVSRIIDNVSIKFYENQLTCLQMNNPITGNALLSMIIKLQHQDSGSIHIYENNRRNQIKHYNQNIGYMPKYDITINELTVEENLWFYTKLKDSETNIKIKDIEGIMKSYHLYDVRYTPVNQLPPYLIRRLCVAIAFVGKSKIILLQDPFYGLDFYSKHVLCDALAEYKTGRTILITTSNVNDAKIVSDKIGIVNDGRLLCYGSKTFLRTIFTKGFELIIELTNKEDIIGIARHIKFLNLPEKFEIDNGIETDSHLINVFLQISNYFIPNSYFVERKGEKYKFIMPYIMKDGMYDCIGNNLALRKLFSLLDKCKNQWQTLRYEFSTLSINEVCDNIKLYDESNSMSNIYSFLYEGMQSVQQFHKSIQLDCANSTTQTSKVDYSILSIDSESNNFNGIQQIIKIIKARFKRNYRNYKFSLQLFLFPFFILFFTTVWIRYIPTPPIIYPAPLNILLNPTKVVIFAKGYTKHAFKTSIKTAVGDKTLRALVNINPTLKIKSLGNKCVYLMEYTNTDVSGCMKSDTTCLITTVLNSSESSIGLAYMNIYEIILTMCNMGKTNIGLKLHSRRDYTISLLHNKCQCNDKDEKFYCPDEDIYPMLINMALYNIYSIDSVSSIPAYLSSLQSPKTIGGFDTLTKNESDIKLLKRESDYKMQELLLKITHNNTIMLSLRTLYLDQIHYLNYLSYLPHDNMKIWFNNRLKTGMPSFLSTYDVAYYRNIIDLKNVYKYKAQSYDPYNPKKTKNRILNRTSIFDDKDRRRQYIDIFGGNDYGFVTINHPIHSSLYMKSRSIIYLYIIIWAQISVTSLITTTILKDMFEDTQCYPHCFQLYTIKPLFYMLSNIIYTNWIYILAINVCLMTFRVNIHYFEKFNHLYGILLYVLYGWALIPFMLTVTYLKPKCSMLNLNIINNGIGFLSLLLEFTVNLFEYRIMTVLITFFIPHYGFEKVLCLLIGATFNQYENKSEPKLEYMLKIFITLIISGIFYYTIVCCYECNIFIRGKEVFKKYFRGLNLDQYVQSLKAMLCCKKRKQEKISLQENIFKGKLHECIIENKVKELERMGVEMSDPALYPILIKNLTSSKLSPINIKGETGCCLGLLGLESGMTPLVSLLTGEFKPLQGDIYIMGHNTKNKKFNTPNFIGYAPKDIYFNVYLTPRECIEFYTSIKYKGSKKSKKVEDFLMNHFDIKETQWIKDCSDGTKRKLLLAIALMLDPPIIIMTEPFLGLNYNDTFVVKKTNLDMVAMGKCVIVLSNSFNDCQHYSKLSIFDDKDMKCYGSIQDLRTSYGNGYMVAVEFNKTGQKKHSNKTNILLAQRLLGTFPSSQIVEFHESYLKVYIIGSNLQISRIFVTLEAVKNLYDIEDYSICLASLEEVLSKFGNSNEDFITENMIRNRLCDIPYVPECFESSH